MCLCVCIFVSLSGSFANVYCSGDHMERILRFAFGVYFHQRSQNLTHTHTRTSTQSLQQTQTQTLTHKCRLAVARGKPGLLLMPQYVSRKGFYLHVRRTIEDVHIVFFIFFILCFGSLEPPAVVVHRPPLQACVFGTPAFVLRV